MNFLHGDTLLTTAVMYANGGSVEIKPDCPVKVLRDLKQPFFANEDGIIYVSEKYANEHPPVLPGCGARSPAGPVYDKHGRACV